MNPAKRICLLFLGVGAMFAPACRRSAPPPPPTAAAPVAVTLAPSQVRSAQRTVEVVGSLDADEAATLSAKVGGRVIRVLHDVGDLVPPGALLAQVDTTDTELARAQKRAALLETLSQLGLAEIPGGSFDVETVPTVRRARAQAANTVARLERARLLFEQKPPVISEQEYADLQTEVEVANRNAEVEVLRARSLLAVAATRDAELRQAEQSFRDTSITVPAAPEGAGASYEIAARLVSVGELLVAGTPVFRVVDRDPIKFRARIPERFAADLAVGQAARVHVESAAEPFAGRVARIAPVIDPESRTLLVEVHVPNAEGALKPGAFARAEILTHNDEGVTFVPREAVVTFAGLQKLFTIDAGKAVEHVVRLGQSDGDFVEVVSGFKAPGDVVVRGGATLATGVPVKVAP